MKVHVWDDKLKVGLMGVSKLFSNYTLSFFHSYLHKETEHHLYICNICYLASGRSAVPDLFKKFVTLKHMNTK